MIQEKTRRFASRDIKLATYYARQHACMLAAMLLCFYNAELADRFGVWVVGVAYGLMSSVWLHGLLVTGVVLFVRPQVKEKK